MPLLGPGGRGAEDASRADSGRQPVTLSPGDALLLGTPALGKGVTGAWDGLSTLWPPFPEGLAYRGDGARPPPPGRALGRGGAPHFAGPLAFGPPPRDGSAATAPRSDHFGPTARFPDG